MNVVKHTVPTLAQIHSENEDAFGQAQLKTLLNQVPPEKWVKKHPMSNVAYVPVEKVEYLLDKIFGRWRLEIKSVKPVFNSICAEIRLWYWNPLVTNYLIHDGRLVYDKEGQPVVIYGEWDYHDGTGAMPVQTDKGASAADLGAIKHDAVAKAAPAAVSYALKDAADHIGIIFGRNVSRKDTIPFDAPFKEDPAAKAAAEPAVVVTQPEAPAAAPVTVTVEVKETPPPPAPVVVVDTTPPVFDANFFSPDGIDVNQPDPNNQEIDF